MMYRYHIPLLGKLLTPQRVAVLVLLAVLLSSCGHSTAAPSWTFLAYLDGDNNLSANALSDLLEMTQAGSSAAVNVVVQIDQADGIPARRYRVVRGGWELLADLGELDMANPQTLSDFLVWAKAAYPADRMVLVLWDHGNGWDQGDGPATPVGGLRRSILYDDENGTGGKSPFLSNHQVKLAIQQAGIRLDLLGLDASNMGTLEALYEFRDLAPIIVSSQEVGQDAGWDYAAILSRLGNDPGMSVEDLSRVIVDSYRDFLENRFYPENPNYEQRHTIAALRTSCLEPLAQAVNELAQSLSADLSDPAQTAAAIADIQAARSSVQEIDLFVQPGVYVDLVDLDRLLNRSTPVGSLLSAGAISEYHGSARPGAQGISIVFFPSRTSMTYDPNYRDYDATLGVGNKGDFLNLFQWDEFLAQYYTAAGL